MRAGFDRESRSTGRRLHARCYGIFRSFDCVVFALGEGERAGRSSTEFAEREHMAKAEP